MTDRPTDKVNSILDAQWYGESPQSKFNYLSLIATEKITEHYGHIELPIKQLRN